MNTSRGFTLIELMVGLLLVSILALSSLELIATNTKFTAQQTSHSSALADAQQIFHVLSDFIKQAEICSSCTPAKSISITYGANINPNPPKTLKQAGDSIQIDFVLPAGYKIWPNDVPPYDSPAIRIAWNEPTGALTIANSATVDGLGSATPIDLIAVSGKASRMVNLDLWPLSSNGSRQASANDLPSGGYELCLTMRSHIMDSAYINPDDNGDLLHYRTATVCGVIFPRNW